MLYKLLILLLIEKLYNRYLNTQVSKMVNLNNNFIVGQHVVYPSHGVGIIRALEQNNFAGLNLYVYVIHFKNPTLELKVPKEQAIKNGLRSVSNSADFNKALLILSGEKVVPNSTLWNKRVKAYMSKLNSGDIFTISLLIKELYPNLFNPSRSFSEKIIFDDAITRLSAEYAITHDIGIEAAKKEITNILDKS